MESALEIIRLACENGVPYLDTAHIYGESQQRIGSALETLGRLGSSAERRPAVVTKIGAAAATGRRLSLCRRPALS